MSTAFDPAVATAAYIDGLGAEALAKSAAYTAGGHWLILWGLVVTALVTLIIVRTRLLERVSARLAARGRGVRTFLVCVAFFALSGLLSLPWAI